MKRIADERVKSWNINIFDFDNIDIAISTLLEKCSFLKSGKNLFKGGGRVVGEAIKAGKNLCWWGESGGKEKVIIEGILDSIWKRSRIQTSFVFLMV